MKITIAIPNFNGEKLLEKNLPNILESDANEVLIVDDKSKDNSLGVLKKFKEKNKKLKVIEHKENLGFVTSVNELFKEANGEIIVLLNNDVWVEKDFIKPVLKHFENDKVFAVTLHETGEGPSVSFWEDGYYQFKRGIEKEIVQKSAWASGGSAVFRKKIWQELGGFDPIFAPFYWEDTDLSFRAIRAGFEIIWEPNSRVTHKHETTIGKNFKKRYINWVQQRNQLLFIWKNIVNKELLNEHRIWLFKRLMTSGIGYIIPFAWALWRARTIKKSIENKRSDMEIINYASAPSLSVIIVSYNSEIFIEKCIASVLKYKPFNSEIIILDNASSDNTVKLLEKFKKDIILIRSSENLGFSKGNNKAAIKAVGDYLFFLNPDTEIEKNIFDELLNFYENHPEVGIVAPKLIIPNGNTQASVRKFPTVFGAIKEFVFGKRNAYSEYVPSSNDPLAVEVVVGAAMLIKKDLFESLKGFDEKFFLYYEDIDICKRTQQLSKKVYYYPKISIKHLVGATKSELDKNKLNNNSLRLYHGKFKSTILQMLFWIPRIIRKLKMIVH